MRNPAYWVEKGLCKLQTRDEVARYGASRRKLLGVQDCSCRGKPVAQAHCEKHEDEDGKPERESVCVVKQRLRNADKRVMAEVIPSGRAKLGGEKNVPPPEG